jgi:hypothetical protein
MVGDQPWNFTGGELNEHQPPESGGENGPFADNCRANTKDIVRLFKKARMCSKFSYSRTDEWGASPDVNLFVLLTPLVGFLFYKYLI